MDGWMDGSENKLNTKLLVCYYNKHKAWHEVQYYVFEVCINFSEFSVRFMTTLPITSVVLNQEESVRNL
jgi:hypothetical protein